MIRCSNSIKKASLFGVFVVSGLVATLFVFSGKAYAGLVITGGLKDHVLPSAGWKLTTSIPAARRDAGVVISGDYIYVLGGNATGDQCANTIDDSSNTVIRKEVYYARIDGQGNVGAWSTTTELPNQRYGRRYVAGNGYIYAIAGDNCQTTQKKVHYAQVAANGTLGSWTDSAQELPQIASERAVASANGYIYVIGGRISGASDLTNGVYYSAIGSGGAPGVWSTGASLPVDLWIHAATVFNNYIYVAGGVNESSVMQNKVYYANINPTTGAVGVWRAGPDLPYAMSQSTVLAQNGYLYTIGGNLSGPGISKKVFSAKISRDGKLGPWQESSVLNLPDNIAYIHSASYNGRAYFAGGGNAAGTFLSSVYHAALSNSTAVMSSSAVFAPFLASLKKLIPSLIPNLVAYYSFDASNIDSTVSDQSGNGKNLSVAARNRHTAGVRGSGLDLSKGGATYSGILTTTSSNTSVSAWIKWNGVKTGSHNVYFGNGYGATDGYILGMLKYECPHDSDVLHGLCMYWANGYAYTGVFPRKGVWEHVVFVNDNNTIRMYYNGIAQTVTQATSGQTYPIAPSGTSSFVGSGWDGAVDEVMVFNKALSAAEVRQLYDLGKIDTSVGGNVGQNLAKGDVNLNRGLVGWWTFDSKDASGMTYYDKSPGTTGKNFKSDNVAWSPRRVVGKLGQAVEFQGRVNDSAYILNNSAFNTAQASVSFWVKKKPGTPGWPKYFILKSTASTIRSYSIEDDDSLGGNNFMCAMFTSTGGFYSTANARYDLSDSKWHHVTCLLENGVGAKAYIDGKLVGSGSTSGSWNYTNASNLMFNMDNDGLFESAIFAIDDLRMYNRILSASEIAQLYRLGK